MRIEGSRTQENLEGKRSRALENLTERIRASNSAKPTPPTLKGRELRSVPSKGNLFELRDQ